MYQAASETYKRWGAALNDILGVLKKQLPASEMSQLEQKQTGWVKYREDTAKAESAEYEGGTMHVVEYTMILADITKQRCYELVGTYMK
jgi:uncharacterized protein YecT (DUF1311 family)